MMVSPIRAFRVCSFCVLYPGALKDVIASIMRALQVGISQNGVPGSWEERAIVQASVEDSFTSSTGVGRGLLLFKKASHDLHYAFLPNIRGFGQLCLSSCSLKFRV